MTGKVLTRQGASTLAVPAAAAAAATVCSSLRSTSITCSESRVDQERPKSLEEESETGDKGGAVVHWMIIKPDKKWSRTQSEYYICVHNPTNVTSPNAEENMCNARASP